MKVALLGATGKAAARLIAELRGRGHEVTGIARNPPAEDLGISLLVADANDEAALADAITGHDALIVAARFVSVDAGRILGALKRAGVPRILVVGGAGTLFAAPGKQVIDLPGIPAANFGPGERTGRYRLGGDTLLRDTAGESRISYEDLAWAMVDELEEPHHRRERFSIAY